MSRYAALPMALLLAGCPQVKKIEEDPGDTGEGGVPVAVQSFMDSYCALSGCHVGGAQAPDLSSGGIEGTLTQTSVSGVPYFTQGDIANSWLAVKMLPDAPGIMPPPTSPAQPSAEEVALVIGWIAGAPLDGGTGGMTTDATATDAMTTSDTTPADMGDAAPTLCTTEMVDNGGTVASIDAGDGAGQIPTAIGDVLTANCGCHYTDSVAEGYVAYSGNQPMNALADFTANFAGFNPNGFSDMPASAAIAARIDGRGMPMALCGVEGTAASENAAMTQEDFDLLFGWLSDGTPDGATFSPG